MENVIIKVSTDALQAKAETVDRLIETMVRQYDDLYRHIKSIAGYWKGEASVKSMECCENDYRFVTEMLQRLREYPNDLRETAGIYVAAEQSVTELSSPLPVDVIL